MPLICAEVALFSHQLVSGSKQAEPYSLCCTLALAAVGLAQPLLSLPNYFLNHLVGPPAVLSSRCSSVVVACSISLFSGQDIIR